MNILERLDSETLHHLKNSAKKAQTLENTWSAAIAKAINQANERNLESIEKNFTPIRDIDFQKVFVEHYFAVSFAAFSIAKGESELDKRLALPAFRIPKSLSALRHMYDQWQNKKFIPKHAAALAEDIKASYLKRVWRCWGKYSEDFRAGDEYTQEAVRDKIAEIADTTLSRAQTIVRTETTNYYNVARKQFYDESEDVTHYLFLAVRDSATTKWCTQHTVDGLRGRHGLVYKKGDPLTDAECPACHWNCRSELVPLTPHNPAHLKLIKDESIARRNHRCHPLPKGWAA